MEKFNLLDKKFLFIPMNVGGGKHWALAVIVNASAIDNGLEYCKGGHKNSSGFDKKKKAPCILYLDSGEVSQTKAVLRCRVLKEWLDYKNTNDGQSADLDTNVYTFSKGSFNAMKTIAVEVPQQPNDFDCGIYVCAFASQMLKLLDKDFNFYDVENKLKEEITNNENFNFNNDKLAKFKRSFRGLVEGLRDCKKSTD